ncbi:MAG TPA: hypothetical protein VKV26_21635 [Dehalococcoidia bacterium]|nr:hypothetical protein [Dehalococcoidia bacterium]
MKLEFRGRQLPPLSELRGAGTLRRLGKRLAGRQLRRAQRELLYARPQRVDGPAGCYWYHTMDLPGLGTVWGEWDLRGRFDDYTGHLALRGKRVLDVGTASGFLTFEAEARGAEVVSLDMDHARRWAYLPFAGNPAWTDPAGFARERQRWYRQLQRGYWLAHRRFRSRARVYYGDVYSVPTGLGMFDVVIVGALLEHLSDPVRALAVLARRSSRMLVITNYVRPDAEPLAAFVGRSDQPWQQTTWWSLSLPLYREVLGMLGFYIRSVSEQTYPWLRDGPRQPPVQQSMHTIVADRPG